MPSWSARSRLGGNAVPGASRPERIATRSAPSSCRRSGTSALNSISRSTPRSYPGTTSPDADWTQFCAGDWTTAPDHSPVSVVNAETGRIVMSEFTVTRTLKAPRQRVWQVLTQPSHFEGWLPAKPGTAALDVRTGGSWQATVISSAGEEIPLTGRYDEVSEPDHLVMTVPGDAVTAITLTSAPDGTTQIAYAFDVDEPMQAMVTESVDEVLERVSTVLAGIA